MRNSRKTINRVLAIAMAFVMFSFAYMPLMAQASEYNSDGYYPQDIVYDVQDESYDYESEIPEDEYEDEYDEDEEQEEEYEDLELGEVFYAEIDPSGIYFVSDWAELAMTVAFLPGDGVPVEIVLMNDMDAGTAIVIGAGQSITLTGGTITQNITNQRHFIVNNGGTLCLIDVNLSGSNPINTTAHGGVTVNAGGHLIMSYGSVIENNRQTNGGGVLVNGSQAMLTLQGGTIRDNVSTTATGFNGGAGVRVQAGGSINITSGSIYGNNSARHGGGVVVTGGSFFMSGGTISDNFGTHGGGVGIFDSTVFTMTGGFIDNNTADSLGGGVNIETDAIFVMSGDSTIHSNVVVAGSAAQGGGGVFIQTGGSFYMYGGYIFENTANHTGGVRLHNGTTFIMHGGSILYNHAIAGNGGGVNLIVGSNFTMYDGHIINNTASGNGGGVHIDSGASFSMYDGMILDNNANGTGGGGGVFMNGAASVFNMSGGMISENRALRGGGVRVSAGTITLDNGNIDDNIADHIGGGVLVIGANSVFTMNGGSVSYNHAYGSNGGGVNVETGASFTLNNGVIYRNSVDGANGGGGIAVIGAASAFTMNGGAIVSNHANVGGGLRVNGTFTMTDGIIDGNTANINGGGVWVSTAASGGSINMAGGTISNNMATSGDGGGVFSANGSNASIVPITAYENIIAAAGLFTGNTAGGGQFALPVNYSDFSFGHLLNNYHINYRGPTPVATVMFILDGGNVGGDIDDIVYIVNLGEEIGLGRVPQPERTNHNFLGWRYEGQAQGTPNLTREDVATISLSQHLIFTAQWQQIIQTPTPTPNPTMPPSSPTQMPSPSTPSPTPASPADLLNHIDIPSPVYNPQTGIHHAYMIGFTDGTIRPRATLTRAEIATMLFRLMPDEVRAAYWRQDNPYSDVSQRRWYNNAISTITNFGLFEGLADDSFMPYRPVTRAELTTLVVRLMEASHYSLPMFDDIDGHWAGDYINAAAYYGWVQGYRGIDGPFLPDQLVTRAEAATLINHAFGRLPQSPGDLLPGMRIWMDNANPSTWYYLHIQEATNSQFYVMKEDGIHKTWVGLYTPERRWYLLERVESRPGDIFG
ncbi:MAG: S-layer homology domain-containing protein [Defluviitaleaceae bacterium]|nr:S-layer homology domain-containing protein [Defluviitaleaceae bacterium]